MATRYVPKKVSLREVRRAICTEAQENPAFLRAIEKAAGGKLIGLLGPISMTGHGGDLGIRFVKMNDQPGYIALTVEIDSLWGGDISMLDTETMPKIARRRTGAVRKVTIAPAIWFHHRGNAKKAVNALSFEELMKVASPETATVLNYGCDRAEKQFWELRRPRREVPRWVYGRRH